MALHTKPPQSDPASVPGRGFQLASLLDEISRQAVVLDQLITGNLLNYVLLSQQFEKIKSARNFIAAANGVGHGSLTSLEVRQYLADNDAAYATAAEVGTLLNSLDTALVAARDEARILMDAREAQTGGAIVVDSGTDMITDPPFTASETAALATEVTAIIPLFDTRTYINGVPQ